MQDCSKTDHPTEALKTKIKDEASVGAIESGRVVTEGKGDGTYVVGFGRIVTWMRVCAW